MNTPWETFLSGHWQRDVPQKSGNYPVATRDKLDAGFRVVYLHPDGEYRSVYEHGGWWWSEPLPDLPSPPAWEEGNE